MKLTIHKDRVVDIIGKYFEDKYDIKTQYIVYDNINKEFIYEIIEGKNNE